MRRYLPKFQNPGSPLPKVNSPVKYKDPGPVGGAKLRTDLGVRMPAMDSAKLVAGSLKATDPGINIGTTTEVGPNKDQQAALRDAIREQNRAERNERRSAGNPFGLSERGLSIMSGISQGVNAAAAIANTVVDSKAVNSNSSGQQAIGNAMMQSGNPYLMAAGAAYNALSVIGEATGMNSSTLNTEQANAAGISKSQKFLNNLGSYVPMLGAAGTKAMDALEMTDETRQLSNAFAGSVGDISTAGTMGGGRYLAGGRKVNNFVAEANRNNLLLTEMNRTNSLRKQSDYGSDIAQQNLNRYAGNNYLNNRMGKDGMKLMSASEVKNILRVRSAEEIIKAVQSFQNGGVIGVEQNIVPEGKLHAHLNHLNELNPELDVTRKGIPVMVKDESGALQEIAEIEVGEIVLRLEVTQQLEALYKSGSEEDMTIAGKLLAEELILNTQDNSKELLNDNENGTEEN